VSRLKQIPWLRVAVEGAAIVISILLAFGIEAWWASEQDVADEQVVLEDLRADFHATRTELESVVRNHDGWRAGRALFLDGSASSFGSATVEEMGAMVTSFQAALTFDPVSNTLDALRNDGRLAVLRSDDLRKALAAWSRLLADIEENEVDVRASSFRVLEGMEPHGGPFHHGILPPEDRDYMPSISSVAMMSMRRDADFVGRVRSHEYHVAFYLRELRALLPVVEEVLDLIDESLR
jgi:hypothetical protein